MSDVEKKDEKNIQSPKEEKKISEVDELKAKLAAAEKRFEAADKEKDDWKNKYYGAYADMANTRKQVEKENAEFKKYAVQSVIKEIVPVLDSFDLALKNEPKDENLKKYLEGFNMIHSKLLNSLKQLGVEIIIPQKGEEYNPNKMEAFSTVDGDEDNRVAEVFLKGYKLHDHLIRPAGVIITKKAVVEKKDEDVKAEKK